jgi:NADH-quinone oxidoreductase subunit F
VILRRVQANDVNRILHDLSSGNITPDHVYCKIEEWDHVTGHIRYGQGYPEVPAWNEVPFFKGQKKIVLRNCGLINPDDIEEYIGIGGYQALYKVLIDGRPENVIEQIKASKLRGRGGAGYLTGNKWEFLAKAKSDHKYIICNADEGDPGAYMNRNEIESDPHSLLEGMIIGGYVMGATEGIIYVRAEYPLAVHRLNRAIEQAREYGMLGDNILGRGFSFNIELVEGAGAFVCGEETALIASLEGQAGRPRPRPPFPAQKGLWGKPTNINNVETWYNIMPIVTRGPAWFTNGQSQKLWYQGFLPGRQDQEHRPGRNATGHAAANLHLRHRRRRIQRTSGQGRADRWALRWMHSARDVSDPSRLRKSDPTRFHHGVGRHGGDG